MKMAGGKGRWEMIDGKIGLVEDLSLLSCRLIKSEESSR